MSNTTKRLENRAGASHFFGGLQDIQLHSLPFGPSDFQDFITLQAYGFHFSTIPKGVEGLQMAVILPG